MRSADRRTADRHAELSNEERGQLGESVGALRGAYGPRWTRVPYGFGDQAQRARKILSTGPLAIKPDAADPVRTVQELGAFAEETAGMAARLLEQVSYLGEALGADVTALPLARLRRLSRAVLRLAEAPVPEPSWAFPTWTARLKHLLHSTTCSWRSVIGSIPTRSARSSPRMRSCAKRSSVLRVRSH